MACAAAAATVRVMKDEKLDENAAARGEQLMSALRGLQKKYPAIGDVRGRGCMVATEFVKDGEPDAATTKAVIAAGARREHAYAQLRKPTAT